jgi:hypothetical protein
LILALVALSATAKYDLTPEQQVERALKGGDPWKFGVGSYMRVAVACLNRAALRKVLHHVHVLKDTKSKEANDAAKAARCYRVARIGVVHTIGKKFGNVRIYGVAFPNGGRAWTFGPDYVGKSVDVNADG